MTSNFCDYGCGQVANYLLEFKSGNKWCCSKNYSACPSNIKTWNKGLTKDKDDRVLKYSESRKGTVPWNKGLNKENSEKVLETSKKISISNTKKPKELSQYPPGYNKRNASCKIIYNECKYCNEIYVWNNTVKFNDRTRSFCSMECYKDFMDEVRRKGRLKYERKPGLKYDKISLIRKRFPLIFNIESIREREDKEIEVKCKLCGEWFAPQRDKLSTRIYDVYYGNGGSYLYCSDECKDKCPLFKLRVDFELKDDNLKDTKCRDADFNIWKEKVFEQNLELYGVIQCEICGNINLNELQVHHEKPRKTHPHLSLDPSNGIVLCGNTSENKCHLKYGHRDKECTTGYLSKL